MSPRCTVCSHEEREAIDEAIVLGRTLRDIARQHGPSKDALSRHKAHVSQSLSRVVAHREEAGAQSALDMLQELYLEAKDVLTAAKEDGKASLSLQAIGRMESIVEKLARLTGELDDRPHVQILNLATAPEWLAVQAALMDALAPFPDARASVAARLSSLPALEAGS